MCHNCQMDPIDHTVVDTTGAQIGLCTDCYQIGVELQEIEDGRILYDYDASKKGTFWMPVLPIA